MSVFASGLPSYQAHVQGLIGQPSCHDAYVHESDRVLQPKFCLNDVAQDGDDDDDDDGFEKCWLLTRSIRIGLSS